MSQAPRTRWFGVRKDLDQGKAAALMAASFVVPFTIWCIASYGPFWDESYRVQISAESPKLQATYVEGDDLVPHIWDEFVSIIRADNAEVQKARDAGAPVAATARQNKKILRQIFSVALANGWLTRAQETDDEVIRSVWLDVAASKLRATKQPLSGENRGIITKNAAMLEASKPEWPAEMMLKLVPEASIQVARPVYLIPPHEVAVTGWKNLMADSVDDAGAAAGEEKSAPKTLRQRYVESLRTILTGFLLAILLAIPLGVLAGTYDFFSKLLEPFTDFFRYMPAPVFGVVLMAIFGLEFAPKIMLVFLGTMPCAILVIANTTRGLDRTLLEAAQTLGANQRQLVTRVVIPGIMPNLYNDLRILLGSAWTWLVIAELLGFKSGLTEIIDTKGRRFQFEHVYPAILLIGLSGFLTDQLLAALGRFFFPWVHPAPGFFSKVFGAVSSFFKPRRGGDETGGRMSPSAPAAAAAVTVPAQPSQPVP
jgi:NitT/TauT family transport system permease protein